MPDVPFNLGDLTELSRRRRIIAAGGDPNAVSDPTLPDAQFGAAPTTQPAFGTPTVNAARVAGAAPSWDRVRDIFGANINGRNVAAPQIFNNGQEQNPLASFDSYDPTPPSLARQLYETSKSPITPEQRAALQNSIIARHNLTRDLETHQQNMGRGLFTNDQRLGVAQAGVDPRQGQGTLFTQANAAATNAGANMIEAQTRAATLEQALSEANQRQRFMERFPHLQPAQINELVAAEQARGGFRGRTLAFPITGSPVVGSSPANSPSAPVAAGTNPSSLLSPTEPTPTSLADIANRIPRSRPTGADSGIGQFVMQLAQTNPGLFANEANRTALRPYLESRFGRDLVAEAAQGTRSLGGLSWSPTSERMAQAGSLGAAGQIIGGVPGGAGLAGYLNRLAGTPQLGPTRSTLQAGAQVAGQAAPNWLSRALSNTRSLAGRAVGAPLAILDAALSLPAAGQMARSAFGGMTPEQEGRAILEAALTRNQW